MTKDEIIQEIQTEVDANLYEMEELLAETRVDWLLDRLLTIQEQHAREVQTAQQRIGLVEGWLSERRDVATRATRYLEEQIRALMPQVDLGKRRSIQLPSGKVGYRKRRPSVDILDRKAALEWAEQHVPDAVKERVTREVVKTPLIEYLQAGNSIDPTAGIVAVPEADVLFIEPGTPVY